MSEVLRTIDSVCTSDSNRQHAYNREQKYFALWNYLEYEDSSFFFFFYSRGRIKRVSKEELMGEIIKNILVVHHFRGESFDNKVTYINKPIKDFNSDDIELFISNLYYISKNYNVDPASSIDCFIDSDSSIPMKLVRHFIDSRYQRGKVNKNTIELYKEKNINLFEKDFQIIDKYFKDKLSKNEKQHN